MCWCGKTRRSLRFHHIYIIVTTKQLYSYSFRVIQQSYSSYIFDYCPIVVSLLNDIGFELIIHIILSTYRHFYSFTINICLVLQTKRMVIICRISTFLLNKTQIALCLYEQHFAQNWSLLPCYMANYYMGIFHFVLAQFIIYINIQTSFVLGLLYFMAVFMTKHSTNILISFIFRLHYFMPVFMTKHSTNIIMCFFMSCLFHVSIRDDSLHGNMRRYEVLS